MVDRKKFDHALAMRQQLEAHYPDRNFQDAFQLSEELRDHFEIKLLVVGHFSAGKKCPAERTAAAASFPQGGPAAADCACHRAGL